MTKLAQLQRLGLFDAKVPRYTSYPPATRFTNAIGAAEAERWLGEIAPGTGVSIYLHVPFCRRLCWFCACRTQGVRSEAPVAAYLEVLKAEVAMVAARLPQGVPVRRIHWGGGTPTLMGADMLRDLGETIAGQLPLSEDVEFSVEIDPNEIDDARLDALSALGMNRASIGVQDFNPAIQQIIGRSQSYDVTRRAVEGLRARGIASLNTDILFGLPNQDRASISETVQLLLSLSPDRVALYGYAHVPWMARRQSMIPTESLPTPEARLELFETARRLFTWDGYREIGIDHFARPEDGLARAAEEGRLRRNFQGYTDDTCDVLIGLGASAISRFPQGYVQNAPATAHYQAAIREGRLSGARGHAFSGEDLARGRMIEALMCDFAVSAEEIVRDFDIAPETVNRLLDNVETAFPGMVRRDATGLAIPPEGRPLTRMIARTLDQYEVEAGRHSCAI